MSPATAEYLRLVRPLARRVNAAAFMTTLLPAVIATLAATAAVMVVLKIALPAYAPYALYLLAALPAAALLAYHQCRARGLFFHPRELTVVVDQRLQQDGLLCAVCEDQDLQPGPNYLAALASELRGALPAFEPAYYLKRIAPALAALAVALAIPPAEPPARQSSEALLQSMVTPLADRLTESAELLTEEQREEFEAQIEQLQAQEEAAAREQWEAVNAIEQRLADAIEQQQAAVEQLVNSMSSLSALMSTGAGDLASLALDAESAELFSQLADELAKAAGNAKLPLDPDQRRKLADMMAQCKSGQCDGSNLSESLKKLAESLEGKCKGGACSGEGEEYGSGGVNRGRGDAPLIFGEESALGDKLDQQALDLEISAPQDLVDLGIVPLEPTLDEGPARSGTVRTYEAGTGSRTSRAQITPSQRATVQRYFRND